VRCVIVGLLMFSLAACAGGGGSGSKSQEETGAPSALLGGETTIFDASSHAYSTPAPNLSATALELHLAGDVAFEQAFVSAGAAVNPGLGPIFNNVACVACHPRDGSGRPPEPGGDMESMLTRISVPGQDSVTGGAEAVPGYGTQLQDKALLGVDPEGRVEIEYEEVAAEYPDGTPYTLRQPGYTLVDAYSALPDQVLLSPRIAPPVFGRGLLEAIDEEDLAALEDPDDEDGDGISGRLNVVWDEQAEDSAAGRFGWKAGAPTLLQQSAGAYQQDMGITSYYFPSDVTEGQPQDDGADDDPELAAADLDAVTFYVQTLAVPAMRNSEDPVVVRGYQLFFSAGCAGCHVASFTTGTLPGVTAVSGQEIHPYTDLLLHDMGEGLADDRPDFLADGREWRTPPLWGIGLRRTVNGHTFFLHDGRAQSIEEAILWHGGEAETARDTFMALPEADRAALLEFLDSL
jgi:CxxC motif-containing protein (DUF1111 family)